MCVGLAIITWFVSLFNVSVKHPGDGKVIHIKSILSHDGFAYIMNNAIKNFSEFRTRFSIRRDDWNWRC